MFTYVRGAAEEEMNCTPPALTEFPSDGLTEAERAEGWIAIHIFISIYIFFALGIVCDEYFVPCVERLCLFFDMSTDIAGATFMAAATSAPELSVNVIGTFITEGDLGIGTIVGSAVFNTLGVAATACLISGVTIKLDWWPLSRDCGIYSISIIALIVVLWDSVIEWYEALVLVSSYIIYILLMVYDKKLQRAAKTSPTCNKIPCFDMTIEDTTRQSQSSALDDDVQFASEHICTLPRGESCLTQICWIIQYPLYFMFFLTIPDCRVPKLRKLFFVSFLMCCVWISILSYLVAWTITAVGDTFHIPDSVMGITFLAIGTSIPEAVSSVVVARRGFTFDIPDSVMGVTFLAMGTSLPETISSVIVIKRGTTFKVPDSVNGMLFISMGSSLPEVVASTIVARKGLVNMAISNAIASNTIDILVCLGLPWLIKTCFYPGPDGHRLPMNHSKGVNFLTGVLLLYVQLFYLTFVLSKFVFSRRAGFLLLLLYFVYLLITSMEELNVFAMVNLPMCPT